MADHVSFSAHRFKADLLGVNAGPIQRPLVCSGACPKRKESRRPSVARAQKSSPRRAGGVGSQVEACIAWPLRSIPNLVKNRNPAFPICSTPVTGHEQTITVNESSGIHVLEEDEDSESDDELEAIEDFDDEEEEEDEALEIDNPELIEEDAPVLTKMVDRVWGLVERVQGGDRQTITADDLRGLFVHPVDKFQRLAIDAFLEGRSVVCCAPTGSGKTLIAEAAAAATLARGRRLFYTTPLKALSNQKLRDFKEMFGENNVGLLTGDAAINRNAPILVMTTEILRNMLYSSVGAPVGSDSRLVNVDAVVLDEVHYLSDIARGTVWEETVIYCPPEVQLVCLSATVANPEELADWIAQVHGPTELITSTKRPVPLTWHYSTKEALYPLLNKKANGINPRLKPRPHVEVPNWDDDDPDFPTPGKRGVQGGVEEGGKRKRVVRPVKGRGPEAPWDRWQQEQRVEVKRTSVPMLRDTLHQLHSRDMLPAIWFIFSRRGCDSAVAKLQDVQLLNPEEEEQVQNAVAKFRQEHPEGVRDSAVRPLLRGLAAHHAGCLPLWKSFVEELFQRGLVKVVFATETLAAGINMPARSTVLATLSKRSDSGHALLSANAMLQMAGRAGRRGIDKQGHVVIVQTPFESAAEACKLLFAGSDPLVSQFTATYGMALNLLQGATVSEKKKDPKPDSENNNSSLNSESTDDKSDVDCKEGPSNETLEVGVPVMGPKKRQGRTLDEARALVERSFGNYVGSEVIVIAKRQLAKLEEELAALQAEQERLMEFLGEDLDPSIRPPGMAERPWKEYVALREVLKTEKRAVRTLRSAVLEARASTVEPLLDHPYSYPPEVALRWTDLRTGEDKVLSALLIDRVPRPFFLEPPEKNEETNQDDPSDDEYDGEVPIAGHHHVFEGGFHDNGGAQRPPPQPNKYYLCLGNDNRFYVVSGQVISSVVKDTREGGEEVEGPREADVLKAQLMTGPKEWTNVGRTKVAVWCTEGGEATSDWAERVRAAEALAEDWEDTPEVQHLSAALETQRKAANKVKKSVASCEAYRELRGLKVLVNRQAAKISKLDFKRERLRVRIDNMAPSGWKEFVRVVQVLCQAGAIEQAWEALSTSSQVATLTPLGELAASTRGTNELWLAQAISDSALEHLEPRQVAALAAALGAAEPERKRGDGSRGLYHRPSDPVLAVLDHLEDEREKLFDLQEAFDVQIALDIDVQVAGMAEAWASGITWRELMEEAAVDEGDVARLLRRTIDMLTQVPHLPHVGISLRKAAKAAAKMMDRPPISELVG